MQIISIEIKQTATKVVLHMLQTLDLPMCISRKKGSMRHSYNVDRWFLWQMRRNLDQILRYCSCGDLRASFLLPCTYCKTKQKVSLRLLLKTHIHKVPFTPPPNSHLKNRRPLLPINLLRTLHSLWIRKSWLSSIGKLSRVSTAGWISKTRLSHAKWHLYAQSHASKVCFSVCFTFVQ